MIKTGKGKIIFLVCFALFFLACVFAFTKIKYKESILVMVPQSVVKEVELFSSSPLSKKFFVVVEARDAGELEGVMMVVTHALQKHPGLKPAFSADADFLLSFYHSAPRLWNKDFEAQITPLLTPQSIEEKMQENISRLMGPEGAFFKDFILADPLGLMPVFAQELKALNITGDNLNFKNGYLTSADGAKALLIFDAAQDSFDREQSSQMISYVQKLNAAFDGRARVFSMGAARYTQENNAIIQTDVRNILIFSALLMCVIFLAFFRSRRAFFIYIVPVLVLIPAAVFTFLIFGEIYGITIGFGSVLMGLAVDYCVYMYFAIKAAPPAQDKNTVVKAMLAPIILSAATSIISFIVLYFCSIELFRQISVFAASGLVYALFLAFVAAPLMFKPRGEVEKDFKFANHTKPLASVIVVSAIIICGVISIRFLSFDTSLDSLNTVSKQFVEDRKVFDSITGNVSASGTLVFVTGENKEAVLRASEALPLELPLTKLMPSEQRALQNTTEWKNFWTPQKISQIKKAVNKTAREYGIDGGAFEGFYSFLATGRAPQNAGEFDLTKIYNPFTRYRGQSALVHVVNGEVDKNLLPSNVLAVSQNLIKEDLFYNVIKILLIVMAVVVFLDFALLMFVFKDFRIVLIGFVPILCGISTIFIVAAVFGFKINLFSLFSIPLIIGLGVDYAIFMIHQTLSSHERHPSRGVAAAALLTLAGFGALIIAKHKVLFAIGLTVAVGISAAVLVSVFLLPAMLKNKKKVVSLLLIIFLFACAGKKQVAYNVPVRLEAHAAQQEPAQYYGELNSSMPFTAVSAAQNNGDYRIIILNDFGIKYADFTVSAGGAQIHSYNFLPKRAVSALALFFKDFHFNRAALKQEAQAYSGAGGRIKVWEEYD